MQHTAPMTAAVAVASSATSSTSSPPLLFAATQPSASLPSLSPCSSIDLAVLSSLDSLRLHLSSFRSSVTAHLHQQHSLQQQQHSHTLTLIQQLREEHHTSLHTHFTQLQAQWQRWKTQHHPTPHPLPPVPIPPPSPPSLTPARLSSLIQAQVTAAVAAATSDALSTIDGLRQRVTQLELALAALPPPTLGGVVRQPSLSLSSLGCTLPPRSLSPSSPSPLLPHFPPSTSSTSSSLLLSQPPRSALKKSVRFNEDLHARLFLTLDADDASIAGGQEPVQVPEVDDEFGVGGGVYVAVDSGEVGGGGEEGMGEGVGEREVKEEGGKDEWEGLGGGGGGGGVTVEVLHSPCASLDFEAMATSYQYQYEREGKEEEVEEGEESDKAKGLEEEAQREERKAEQVDDDIGLTDLAALPADEDDSRAEAEEQKEAAGDASDASPAFSDSSSDDEEAVTSPPFRPPPASSSFPSLSLPLSSRAKSSLAIRARPASTAATDPEALLSILHPVAAVKQGEVEEVEEQLETEQEEVDSSDDGVELQVGDGEEHDWRVSAGAGDASRGDADDSNDDDEVVLVKG